MRSDIPAAMPHPCPRCEKAFKTPATLARHTGAKKPCVDVVAAREAARAAGASDLEKQVWAARNIMRRVGLTGMDALDALVSLFALREVERLFPRLGEPASFALPKPSLLCPVPAEVRVTCVENRFVLFSKITATPFDDGEQRDWAYLVRNALLALKFHPDTREPCRPLYEELDKIFPLTDSKTAHELARFVRDKIAFDQGGDTAGRAYMSVVRGFLDGKELGQFFTPTPVVDYLVRRAGEGRNLGTVVDPTCGSGGFLAAAARAGAATVQGCEIDLRVRLLGYFSALAAGAAAPRVARGDFLRGGLEELGPGARYETILANPPFGVKGVTYDELVDSKVNPLGPDIFPIKSSATGLFLQRIVYTLHPGGRGCVVLPLGKELAGRTPAETKLRRALLRALALREVVVIPAGAFENTGIRTVALIFDKVRELGECVTRRKAGKGYTVELKALEAGAADATTDFRITRLRTAEDGKTVLPEAEPIPGTQRSVSIEELEEHGWSLSPDDYNLGGAAIAEESPEGFAHPMVVLGDLCNIAIGGTPSTSQTSYYISPPDGFPWVSIADLGNGGQIRATKKHITQLGVDASSVKLVKRGTVLFSFKLSVGKVGIAGSDLYTNEAIAALMLRAADRVTNGYLYHALGLKLYRAPPTIGIIGKGSLNKRTLAEIEIPLPPLELQRAIAAELDEQAADAATLEKAAAAAERAKKIVLDNAIYKWGFLGRTLRHCDDLAEGVRGVQLGNLFNMKKGKTYTTKALAGQYPLYTSGAEQLSSDAFDETEKALLIACEGTVGHTHAPTESKYSVGHRCYILREKTEGTVEYSYLNWFFRANRADIVAAHARGAVTQTLNAARLAGIEVPLPPVEIQRAIAAELDELDATAKGLTRAAERARAGMRTTLMRALAAGGPARPGEEKGADSNQGEGEDEAPAPVPEDDGDAPPEANGEDNDEVDDAALDEFLGEGA